MKSKFSFVIIFSLVVVSGCKKMLEIDPPPTQLEASVVYSNDATAIQEMTGIYIKLGNPSSGYTGSTSISFLGGLSSDELKGYTTNQPLYMAYQNALTQQNAPGIWSSSYSYIYQCNSVISGVGSSSGISNDVKQQLLGEAKFMRAFFYFYLVNFYGDVPLVTTTDYNANSLAVRVSKDEVYKSIIADLKDAQNILSNDFVGSDLKTVTTERIRPSKWAATALLSRVYLYTGDYNNAFTAADGVITNISKFSLTDLDNAFLKNNKEAIWQLQPIQIGRNTEDAAAFVLPGAPTFSQPVSMNKLLVTAFEQGDVRRTKWISSILAGIDTLYYPYKYKKNLYDANNPSPAEYLVVLRLGELYLIRAEAEANNASGGLAAAVNDLNVIRKRAGLGNYNGTNNKDSVIAAIMHERQVELFTEFGHRWLDLKRIGKIEMVMGAPGNVAALKGGVWNSNSALYPIPLSDIQRNPNLKQNLGY